METNKFKQITNIKQQTPINCVKLIKNPDNIEISLAFPEIIQVSIGLRETSFSHPTLEKESERSYAALEGRHSSNGPCSDNGYMQICLLVIDKNDSIIQHNSIEQFDQYLKNNNIVKCVKIHTIQVSKTGKIQQGKYNTIIDSGKNIGKKSETSILQQAIYESFKKYNQHTNNKNNSYPHFMLLDLYKYQKSNITTSNLDSSSQLLSSLTLGEEVKEACLLKRQGSHSSVSDFSARNKIDNDIQFPQFIQRKYDGLRCGILLINNKITLISRGQKEFTSLQHIQQDIQKIFDFININSFIQEKLNSICKELKYNFQHSILFDGELYLHGKSLQTINSLIRNSTNTPEKLQIQFMMYDLDITVNNRQQQIQLPFITRNDLLNILQQIIQDLNILSILIAPTLKISNKSELQSLFDQFIQDKYEGAVLRHPQSLYCYSINKKRSHDTLKYKLKLDMEVQIVNYSDGIGKDSECIIFECSLFNQQNKTFQVVQNTSYDNRKQLFQLLKNNPSYLSILQQIPLNIEYAILSESGIPQQPRGIYFRTESIDIDIPDQLLKILEQ